MRTEFAVCVITLTSTKIDHTVASDTLTCQMWHTQFGESGCVAVSHHATVAERYAALHAAIHEVSMSFTCHAKVIFHVSHASMSCVATQRTASLVEGSSAFARAMVSLHDEDHVTYTTLPFVMLESVSFVHTTWSSCQVCNCVTQSYMSRHLSTGFHTNTHSVFAMTVGDVSICTDSVLVCQITSNHQVDGSFADSLQVITEPATTFHAT